MLNLATATTYTMPATLPPANSISEMDNPPHDAVDSDQDAEGEEETDFYQMDQQLQNAVHRAYTGEVAAEENIDRLPDEDKDAEGEPDKDAEGEPDVEAILDGDNDDAEPVGAVKLPDETVQSSDNDEEADADAEAEADPALEHRRNGDDDDSSSSSSQASDAEDWEAESNGHEDGLDTVARGNCM